MKLFDHLEGIISAKKTILYDFFSLLMLEARLARLSIYSLLFYLVLLIPFLITIWLLGIVSLAYLMLSFYPHELLTILFGLLALNIVCFLMTLRGLKTALEGMSFNKTRYVLSNQQGTSHE